MHNVIFILIITPKLMCYFVYIFSHDVEWEEARVQARAALEAIRRERTQMLQDQQRQDSKLESQRTLLKQQHVCGV